MADICWEDIFNPEALEKSQDGNPFKKLNDTVYELMEDAIITYRIPTNTKLSPVKIAELLNVSRTPVTEALERLRELGLVVTSPDARGYFVFDISRTSLENLFSARRAIEGEAAFLCAQNNFSVDLPRLESLAKMFRASFEKQYFKHFSMLDKAFHNLLVESCGNPILVKMYQSIDKLNSYYSIRSQEYMNTVGTHPDAMTVAGQHMSIYHAVEMGIPELAKESMDRHMDSCYILCLRYHTNVGGTK